MHVLVTGGAGFIGSHTVDLLVSDGHKVTVLDVLDPQVHGKPKRGAAPRWLASHLRTKLVRFQRGDVTDRKAVAKAIDRCDAVLHLAAAVGVGQSMYQPAHYTAVNAGGTAMILDVLASQKKRRVTKLVVASSMSIYGEGAYRCESHGAKSPRLRAEADLAAGRWEPVCDVCGESLERAPTREDKPLDPTSIYAIAKRYQEDAVLLFGAAYGIPSVALRYFNVYGPRQSLSNPYTGVAAIFTSRLLNGARPAVFEDGRQTRDFVHVRDVARANVLALTRAEGDGRALNVGTGRAISIAEVAILLAKRLGKDLPPDVNGKYRPGDVRHCIADIATIRAAYGYEPRVSFEDGLAELVEWSRSEKPKDQVGKAMRELAARGLVR